MGKNKRATIVAAIHGDEVYGVELYETFISKYPELSHYVSLVIGNQKAYKEHKRYIDTDLNCSYLITSSSHELEEIKHIDQSINKFNPDYIFDIHTTRRDSGIFFISDKLNPIRKKMYEPFSFDVCVIKDAVIRSSFIGQNDIAISLEYSLNSISDNTTNNFVDNLMRLITNKTSNKININQRIYDVDKLISHSEYLSYKNLKNYDEKSEGVALMVPKDNSEMDAEYYGFWCKLIS